VYDSRPWGRFSLGYNCVSYPPVLLAAELEPSSKSRGGRELDALGPRPMGGIPNEGSGFLFT